MHRGDAFTRIAIMRDNFLIARKSIHLLSRTSPLKQSDQRMAIKYALDKGRASVAPSAYHDAIKPFCTAQHTRITPNVLVTEAFRSSRIPSSLHSGTASSVTSRGLAALARLRCECA